MNLKSSLAKMKAYKPGKKPPKIKLDANEANYLIQQLDLPNLNNLNRYPDSYASDLTNKLANVHKVSSNQILIGQGSSELLELIVKSYLEPGETVVSIRPSFVMYEKYANYYNGLYKTFSLREDMTLDLELFLDFLEEETPKIIFLASPNNPSGTLFSKQTIQAILEKTNAILVLDEAYMDFVGEDYSMIDQIDQYKNLFITRTFSKAYGLAALRIGYLVGHVERINQLKIVKTPYSTSSLSQELALKALDYQEEKDTYLAMIKENKTRLEQVLKDMNIQVFPSSANFLFIQTDLAIGEYLEGKNIRIRVFPDNYYRITIPSNDELFPLLNALKEMNQS